MIIGIFGASLANSFSWGNARSSPEQKGDQAQSPERSAFDQFERADASSIARFLNSPNALSDDAAKAADNLGHI